MFPISDHAIVFHFFDVYGSGTGFFCDRIELQYEGSDRFCYQCYGWFASGKHDVPSYDGVLGWWSRQVAGK